MGQGQAGSKLADAVTEKKLLNRIRALILTMVLSFKIFFKFKVFKLYHSREVYNAWTYCVPIMQLQLLSVFYQASSISHLSGGRGGRWSTFRHDQTSVLCAVL